MSAESTSLKSGVQKPCVGTSTRRPLGGRTSQSATLVRFPGRANALAALCAAALTFALSAPSQAGILSPRDLSDVSGSSSGQDLLFAVLPLANGNKVVSTWTHLGSAGLDHPALTALGPTGNVLWANQYGGSKVDEPSNTIVTSDGNLLTVGSTPSFGGLNHYTAWAFKVNPTGQLLWQKNYFPAGGIVSFLADVVEIPTGGYYFFGDILASDQSEFGNLVLLRVDADGNLVSSQTIGTTSEYSAGRALLRSNGDLLLLASDGITEVALLIDLTPAGTIAWQIQIPEVGGGDVPALTETQDGGVLLGGEVSSVGAGNRDLLLARFDASGSFLWSRTYGTTADDFSSSQNLALPDGSFLVAGTTELQLAQGLFQSGFILRVSATGEILSQQGFSTDFSTSADTIVRDAAGSFYLGSQFSGEHFHWGLAQLSNTGAVGALCSSTVLPISLATSQQTLVITPSALPISSSTATAANTTATVTPFHVTVNTVCDEPAPPAACTPSATNLCLGDGRFQVSTSFRTPAGLTGQGQAVTLTDDTGYFWFFSPTNVEMLLKTLDGCSTDEAFWVFGGGLTDVRVGLTVTDTLTGQTKTYANPQNTPFQPIQDTSAFSTCSATPNRAAHAQAPPPPAPVTFPLADSTSICIASPTRLCLNNNRFQVDVSWKEQNGQAGFGNAVKLTADTGYFWFFGESNVEMVLKVLDACSAGSGYWVFSGGLTDVNTVITVTDTLTGAKRIYTNPQNTAFQPIQDTGAFTTCP
jgi:hypothetical protein